MPSRYCSRQLVILSATPMTKAKVKKMRSLIQKDDADPNHIMDGNQIALHNILLQEKMQDNVRYSAVDCLVGQGADINLKNPKTHAAALPMAVADGRVDLLSLFIKKKCDLNIQDGAGNTALHYAVENNHTYMVKALIEAGAANGIINANGETALDLAERLQQTEIADLIADAPTVEKQRITSLFLAVSYNQIGVTEELLNNGAGVNSRDDEGNAAIHYAAEKGHTDMVAFLMKRGARVDIAGKEGKTALHLAAEKGDQDMVRCLMDFNASSKALDKSGKTAADLAQSCDKKEIKDYILNRAKMQKRQQLKNYVRGLRK